jgi:hypothetical protein
MTQREARMGLQFRRAALAEVAAVAASLACWIALVDLAVAEETGTAAPSSSDNERNRSSDHRVDPVVPLEPPSPLATKQVDEEVRELLRQTDQLDEESDKDLQGDAPLPPSPELAR